MCRHIIWAGPFLCVFRIAHTPVVFHVCLINSNYAYEFTLCIRIHIMYMNSHYVYDFTLCIRIHIMYSNSPYVYEFVYTLVYEFAYLYVYIRIHIICFIVVIVMCMITILNIFSHLLMHVIFFFRFLETTWIRKLMMIYLSLLSHWSHGTNPCLWTMW
jgi:hypothetical protein